MAGRKGLSKKTRFEVFKRDKFTCQYCGRMSPDVILEVDHIKPIAEGGTNRMMNLIILDGIDIAFAQYYKGDHRSAETALKKVGGICYNRRKQKQEQEDGNL